MKSLHIIGAGPAGCSLAVYALEAGIDNVYLYEQSSRVGGLARSWNHDKFTLDTGPHIFHTDDQEIIKDWERLFPEMFDFGTFYSGNVHHQFPEKIFDYPISLQTLKKNLPEHLSSCLIAEYEQAKNSTANKRTGTFADYVNNNLGNRLADMFFKDYPEKLWGLKTTEMLAEWAPQRLSIRKKIEPFYTKKFVAVAKKGTGSIFERIVKDLGRDNRFKLLLNHQVVNLASKDNKIESIITNRGGYSLGSEDIVVSTIPATILSRILNHPINLSFRGVQTLYMFFKSKRVLPKGYNWMYITDPSVRFNRITEPTSMATKIAPEGFSYICVESTYSQESKAAPVQESFNNVIKWLEDSEKFDASGFIPNLNTFNNEDFVYPIQDAGFRSELSKYNSIVSAKNNLYTLGTGGEFHYSDIQIIFRKSKELASSLLKKDKLTDPKSIPHVNTLTLSDHPAIEVSQSFSAENLRHKTSLHRVSGKDIPLIAEIGINHNGDIELANEMISSAKSSGADFAKFQYYSKGSRLESNSHTKYVHETADDSELSLIEIFDRAALSLEDCKKLINHGKNTGIPVFFTAFDIPSARELKKLGQTIVKTASMDLNNLRLHKEIATLGFETVIISTGMSDIREITRTLQVYADAQELLIMSCRSAYPTSFEDVDLGEISYLEQITNKPIGFSDHTQDLYASVASVVAGATFIERHFTLDQSYIGPDNPISLVSSDLVKLCPLLEAASKSIRTRRKIIHPVEQNTFAVQKKSLRFPSNLSRGAVIHTNDLVAVAPPEGFSEFHIELKAGSYRLLEDVSSYEPITSVKMEFISEV